MGASLSQQEELFVKCDWGELVILAAQEDLVADDEDSALLAAGGGGGEYGRPMSKRKMLRDTIVSASHRFQSERDRKRNAQFKMSSQEWQALMCLAEEPFPSEAPSTVLSTVGKGPSFNLSDIITVPFVASLSHVSSVAEGVITVGEGLERIMALRQLAVEIEEEERTYFEKDDGDASFDSNITIQSSLVGIAQDMLQSVYLRQYGNAGTAPSLFKDESLRKRGFGDNRDANVNNPILSSGEAVAVMEDAQRLVRKLFRTAAPFIGDSSDLFDDSKHTSARQVGPHDSSQPKRPVYALAVYLMSSLCLVGSTDAALRALMASDNSSSGASLLTPLVADAVGIAMSMLRKLDAILKAHGYKALVSDTSNSISGDFAVIRRLLETMRGKLLLLDVIQMRNLAVLPKPPTRPKSKPSWSDLPNSYVGQKALQNVISRHFTARARGVVEDNKPTVLLFFGPSGHGKSELAKTIAKILHPTSRDVEGDGKLVMIHLPSFCTKDSIYSLVDPPAAHVGEGMLLSALRREPSAVVVLDEFEKSTADSIQNLWLSAFQKEGMLRSLKDSARSQSTIKTTFVLTCNLCDQIISATETLYLAADEEGKEQLRKEYIERCRKEVRERFGEPFLNRVDFFLPFVPYSVEEKRQFAGLQLASIASQQYTRFRRLLIPTPSYLLNIAARTRNFHTASIGQGVQDVLMEFPDAGVDGEGGALSNTMIRFAHSSSATEILAESSGVSSFSMDREALERQLIKVIGGASSTTRDAVHSLVSAAIQRQLDVFEERSDVQPNVPEQNGGGVSVSPLPAADGSAVHECSASPGATPPVSEESIPPTSAPPLLSPPTSEIPSTPEHENATTATLRRRNNRDATSRASPERVMLLETQTDVAHAVDTTRQSREGLAAEVATAVEMATDTALVVEKDLEIKRLTNLMKEKDMEIETLKTKVKQLEKVMAMLFVFVIASALLLSLVVGTKIAFLLLISLGTILYLLVDNCFVLIAMACRALYNLLGPIKSAVGIFILLCYVGWGSRISAVPCTRS